MLVQSIPLLPSVCTGFPCFLVLAWGVDDVVAVVADTMRWTSHSVSLLISMRELICIWNFLSICLTCFPIEVIVSSATVFSRSHAPMLRQFTHPTFLPCKL